MNIVLHPQELEISSTLINKTVLCKPLKPCLCFFTCQKPQDCQHKEIFWISLSVRVATVVFKYLFLLYY